MRLLNLLPIFIIFGNGDRNLIWSLSTIIVPFVIKVLSKKKHENHQIPRENSVSLQQNNRDNHTMNNNNDIQIYSLLILAITIIGICVYYKYYKFNGTNNSNMPLQRINKFYRNAIPYPRYEYVYLSPQKTNITNTLMHSNISTIFILTKLFMFLIAIQNIERSFSFFHNQRGNLILRHIIDESSRGMMFIIYTAFLIKSNLLLLYINTGFFVVEIPLMILLNLFFCGSFCKNIYEHLHSQEENQNNEIHENNEIQLLQMQQYYAYHLQAPEDAPTTLLLQKYKDGLYNLLKKIAILSTIFVCSMYIYAYLVDMSLLLLSCVLSSGFFILFLSGIIKSMINRPAEIAMFLREF